RHRRHFDQSGTEPTTAGTSRRRASGPAGERAPTGHRPTTRTTLWATAGSTTRHPAGRTARNARVRRPERTVVTVLAVLRSRGHHCFGSGIRGLDSGLRRWWNTGRFGVVSRQHAGHGRVRRRGSSPVGLLHRVPTVLWFLRHRSVPPKQTPWPEIGRAHV